MNSQKSRGFVRLVVAAIASYFWLSGQIDRAMSALIFGQALNGWLGYNDKPAPQ